MEHKKKKINSVSVKKEIFIICMLIYPIAQFLVFFVYMNFNNIKLAFFGYYTDGSTYWAGLTNFKNIFAGIDTSILITSAWNNIKMFILTLIIGMPLNILFGFYLYKKKFGSTIIRIVYMLPHMVSGVVMTLLFMKFVEVGLPVAYESVFGEVLPNLIRNNDTAFGVQVFYTLWLGFSTSIIYYSNAMFAIDESVIEAGLIDGTTPMLELRKIVLPLIMPTISTYLITGVACIFTISGSLFLFYGLSDVPRSTYMMGFYMFKIAMEGDLTAYPMASAVSMIITFVTIPLTTLVRWLLNRFDPMRDVHTDIA